MNQIQNDLPIGWVTTTLGEVTQPYRPRENPKLYPKLPFIGMENIEAHSMRLLGTVPANTMKSNAVHFFPNDVLYGRLRPYLNKVFRPDFEGLCSSEFIVFSTTEHLNAKFLQYLLNSSHFVSFASHLNEGDRPRVDFNQIGTYEFRLPPFPEQARIVARIEELLTQLDAGVEELLKARAQLKRYRQAVLKAAVTGELTRKWREAHKDQLEPASELLARILQERRVRWESDQLAKLTTEGRATKNDVWKRKYDEPVSPDATTLPQLPNGWIWVTMPHLGELSRGKSKHRPRNAPHLYNGDYPFIQTGDIRRASGLLRQYRQTYSEAGLKQSRLWPKGTLCITIAANIAETAILGFDACFPDSVVGFRAESDSCDVRFVDFFIRTAKQNLERYAPATAQKNINIEILSDIAIPFPSILEQRQIADEVERILSITDASEQIIEARLKQAERLRQSILKQAFEGKLVAQDPNDEPAELLLERIKTERAKRDAEKQAEAKSNRKRFTKNRLNRTQRPAA